MPKSLTSVAEAMTAFMQIIGSAKESLRKILLRGEFEEYDLMIATCIALREWSSCSINTQMSYTSVLKVTQRATF
ncbi:hypothetical protein ACFX2A_013870 [Malus domestica]